METPLELTARACDLALLQTAANYDLYSREDRYASHYWLVELFGRLVTRAIKPQLVLELGAFSADFSCGQRPRLPDAQFHAFEANPHNYERYRTRVEAAGVGYHPLAVGEAVGERMFNLAIKRDGKDVSPTGGSHSLRTKALDIAYEEIPVQMVTVDDFVREQGLAGRSVALWIDLEGAAYEALIGAERTLADTSLIFVEVEDQPFWTGQKLSGEVRSLLARSGLIPLARDFQSKQQYNVIYGKPDIGDHVEARQILAKSMSKAGKRARALHPEHAEAGVGNRSV